MLHFVAVLASIPPAVAEPGWESVVDSQVADMSPGERLVVAGLGLK